MIAVSLPPMWPGEQPPGGGHDQQHQQHQQPNPYQQAGYQQTGPHGGPAPWNAPTATMPAPPGGGGRAKVIALVAAAAVVVAAAVTGAVLLGGGSDDEPRPGPTASSASASASPSVTGEARGTSGPEPTVDGWKTVVNRERGIAFDVPADWARQSPDWVTYVSEDDDPEEKPLVGMQAPAVLEEKWCSSDDDRDGQLDDKPLATAGSRGNNGAKSTEEIARTDSATWVYGLYTQPDRKKVTTGGVASFTTASGITGSLATARSSGVVKQDKCDSDGKATTFAFKDSDGDFVSWSFVGAAGVSEEVPDATVRKILATVRLVEPSGA